jgi:hypothetical protein
MKGTDATCEAKSVTFVLSHDEPGGARNLWEQIASALAMRAWATNLRVIYRKDDPAASTWQPVQHQRLSLFGMVPAILRLAAVFREERPLAVLAAQPAANVISALAGALARVPVRMVSHHTPLNSYGWPQRILDLLVGCTPAVTHIVCVSEGVKLSLVRYPAVYLKKVMVVRNALSTEIALLTSSLRAHARQTRAGPLKLVAAGRLAEQKN